MSAKAPRALFQDFSAAVSADRAISEQLRKWETARREWRLRWTGRAATSVDVRFDRLTPRSTSDGAGGWEHPVVDEAPELNAWRTAWQSTSRPERQAIAAAFERALALTEAQDASSGAAFTELARLATAHELPLAVVTPAFSSLDPDRFVVICDTWLTALGKFAGAPVQTDVAAYPELNTFVLNWFSAAEGDSVAPALGGSPRADRFGVFCSWVGRTNTQDAPARFDVTKKKYKDWPPMW